MVNFLNLPTVQAPRNALADLSPIGNAIDGNRRNALMVQENARQQEELGMRKSQFEYQQTRDKKQDARSEVEYFGKQAAAIDQLQGPERAKAYQNLIARHPGRASLTPEYLDPVNGPKLIMAEAGQFRDPREDQMKNLEIQRTQAQINQLNQRADDGKVMEVNGRLVRVPKSGPAQEIYAPAQSGPNAAALSKGAPAGYVWKDPNNAAAGVEQIAGYEKAVPGDVAGKIAMMNMAKDRIANTRATLERSWGVKDLAKNVAANVPFVGDLAWASGDIGIAQRDVRTGIEAALRTMTGAAAPEQEVVRYMQMFAPSVNDTQQSAKQKLDGLMRFMEDADRIVMQGRGDIGGTPSPQNQATDLKSKYGLE